MNEYELTIYMNSGSKIEVNVDSELDTEELSNSYGEMYLKSKDKVINMKEVGTDDISFLVPINNVCYFEFKKTTKKE